MKTKNGLNIIGIFKKTKVFVVEYDKTEYLMTDTGQILDFLNENEKYSYENNLSDKEIRKVSSINAFLSKELDVVLEKNHPIRTNLHIF